MPCESTEGPSRSRPLPAHAAVKRGERRAGVVAVLMAEMFFVFVILYFVFGEGGSVTENWRGAPRGLLQMRLD